MKKITIAIFLFMGLFAINSHSMGDKQEQIAQNSVQTLKFDEEMTDQSQKKLEWEDLPTEIKHLIIYCAGQHQSFAEAIKIFKNLELVNAQFRALVNDKNILPETITAYALESLDQAQNMLMKASISGDARTVKCIKSADFNLQVSNAQGKTALMVAAELGYKKIVKYILKGNSEVNSKDPLYNLTALLYACGNKHKDVVKKLIFTEALACADDTNKPLLIETILGEEAKVSALLEQGSPVDGQDDDGRTPLMFAAASGNKYLVELLIENGANIDQQDRYGTFPLLLAAHFGHVEVAALLVSKGADINAQDASGTTALMRSLRMSRPVAEFLIVSGAKLSIRDKKGKSALMYAAQTGVEEVKLITEGVAISTAGRQSLTWTIKKVFKPIVDNFALEECDDLDRTPLIYAVLAELPDVVELLINEGANVNATDTKGLTPLIYSAHLGNVEIVKILLNKNAIINSEFTNGQNALITAATRGHLDVVTLLCENGANIDTQGDLGNTALCAAAYKGHKEIIAFLINNNANVLLKNKNNYTALDLAGKQGHSDIVAMLVEATTL